LILREIAEETSLDEVIAATAAPLQVPEGELPRF
jgi:acyl CoA:acetate/3-ketoacid CoA transferase beta subunit